MEYKSKDLDCLNDGFELLILIKTMFDATEPINFLKCKFFRCIEVEV